VAVTGGTIDEDALRRAGLYDPAAPDAAARRALLRYIADRGATVEQMVEADRGGNLVSLGFDLVLEQGDLSARQLADRTGTALDELIDLYRGLGVPVDDADAPVFDAEEVELVDRLRLTGAAQPIVEEVNRSLAAAMALLATTAVSAFVGTLEDELEAAGDPLSRAEVTTAVGELALDLASRLRPLFRHHLRLAVARQRAAMGMSADRRSSHLGVGFVDLVGFTATSAGMTSAELVAFTGAFHRRAHDVVTRRGGQVVKHIGDEIMYSAVDPARACRIGLALIDAFEVDVRPRGGLAYGPMVARYGDLYGPTVNLASRLADIAVPGELLAGADIATAVAAAPDGGVGLRFEPAGRRLLKGFDEPLVVTSVSLEPGTAEWGPPARR
jgi:class 3 adenylate cyclase